MDCNQFQEVLADLDRPGVLTAELLEKAFAHAEACGNCGQLLTETESLDAELRRLAERDADMLAPIWLETKLLTAFREHKTARAATWRYSVAIGVAAMLLLAVGFWRNQGKSGNDGPTKKRVVVVQPKTEARSEQPRTIDHSQAQPANALRPAAKVAAAQDAEADSAIAFISLPNSDPAPPDDGAVVRVEMPRAALATFGLPVEAMEGDGTVRADLIVSADGTPQAIRLVPQDDANAAVQP